MAYYKYKRICKKCNREYLLKEPASAKRYCNACRRDLGFIEGKKVYSGHFYRQRLIVLQRDKNQCQGCKKKIDLAVHHIDVTKNNNSLSNLITLCSSCHKTLHNSYKKLELRRGNIYTLLFQMKTKKMKDKLSFLEKIKNRVIVKPKKFIIK